jgi:hypothetical protein
MADIKLPWSTEEGQRGTFEIDRFLPNGEAIKVSMARATADSTAPCLSCLVPTPRVTAIKRTAEGEYRTIRLCDFCTELLGQMALRTEFHGV